MTAQKYLDTYLELGILKQDPFLTIDREGVGSLILFAMHTGQTGQQTNQDRRLR